MEQKAFLKVFLTVKHYSVICSLQAICTKNNTYNMKKKVYSSTSVLDCELKAVNLKGET